MLLMYLLLRVTSTLKCISMKFVCVFWKLGVLYISLAYFDRNVASNSWKLTGMVPQIIET